MKKNKLILAPIAGFSTPAFRKIAKRCGADIAYSEMISDRALIYQSEKTWKLIGDDQDDVIQLFGNSAETMGQAAKMLVAKGFKNIDINFGCPVPKVFKQGAGCALMKNIDLAVAIAKAVIASGANVSAKMRLGLNDDSLYLPFALALEQAGVKAIALHCRTRNELFQGKGHPQAFAILKKHLKIPLIANGGIDNVEDAMMMLNDYQVDSLMIGRAALGNPMIFQAIKKRIVNQYYQINIIDNILMGIEHIKLINDQNFIFFRAQACSYLKGFPDCARFRLQAVNLYSKQQFIELFMEVITYLKTTAVN